ncbi:hypothetical protein [Poseidonocella sp. HB161398]|uniref:hypothetical protein n=1 Tax=Poseidonocella sp. HB161398 TaxID=2320855 RepID=UPI0011095889|nr:hypothetical protein [Poseidonocella sp. HB161398]
MARKTNAEIARDAENRVRDLIASCEAGGTTLPTRKGALWHAEIKRLAGLSNGQIDGNAAIRALLLDHAGRHGIAFSRRGAVAPEEDVPPARVDTAEMVPAARLLEVQRQLAQAERRLAEMRAEIASLRAQILRGDDVAELIALGGRFAPPGQR